MRAQDRLADDLELIIAQRRAGLGDIDDHIGVAQAGRGLSRPLRVHQPEVVDAVGVAEAPGQRGVLGGDPQRAALPMQLDREQSHMTGQ